ncbi:hypothetical protein STEG23_036469 [Scotinomys teguina]
MTVTPLGRDQGLKIREPDVPAPWFLDPGGWSKTAAVSLSFIFPGICTLSLLSLEVPPPLMFPMTVTPLGRDQDCSLKIREPDVPAPWFLDPGGWSKTAAVSLSFIFPGICTLSLAQREYYGGNKKNIKDYLASMEPTVLDLGKLQGVHDTVCIWSEGTTLRNLNKVNVSSNWTLLAPLLWSIANSQFGEHFKNWLSPICTYKNGEIQLLSLAQLRYFDRSGIRILFGGVILIKFTSGTTSQKWKDSESLQVKIVAQMEIQVEHLMGHNSRSREDSGLDSNSDYDSPNQEVSEENNLIFPYYVFLPVFELAMYVLCHYKLKPFSDLCYGIFDYSRMICVETTFFPQAYA